MNLLSSRTVSFDDENLVLVDKDDQAIGYKKKNQCHHNNGVLHRAFSILIFNDNNELLLQKRSRNKLLWPLFWSNSCCSHPRQGESLHQATQRRMNEELGFNTALKFIFKFQYHAKYQSIGSENELCHVFIGKWNGKIHFNQSEIEQVQFININKLSDSLSKNGELYTPWFVKEWNIL